MAEVVEEENREIRVINRNFSLGEYDSSWTKMERYLFIEIYNVIKEFYLDKDNVLIESFSDESIRIRLPIDMLNPVLFNKHNRSKQILDAAEGLMDKKIKYISEEEGGQLAFDFITMFQRIRFNPKIDSKHIYINIPNEIYEEMVPIESYCQLDLVLLSEFNSGNTSRLYEVFKSHAFRKNFNITFTDLRKQLGFYYQNKYPVWKYFNDQVLKPAVEDINSHKEFDIEVKYNKQRGKDVIEFTLIAHRKLPYGNIKVLDLDDEINAQTRRLNMLQAKYVKTLIGYCAAEMEISNEQELTAWITSDLINQQTKLGKEFNFKHAMNAISKQIRKREYKEPFSHKYLTQVQQFNDDIHNDIKTLLNENKLDQIRVKYTNEQLVLHRFAYLLEMFEQDSSSENMDLNGAVNPE